MTETETPPGTTGSLEASDAAAAAVQKTPRRVTLDYLQSRIAQETYFHPPFTPHMTICVLRTVNGFTVVGQAAPADPGNFNVELGRKFSREDAVRHLWPLEGFLLCEEIYRARGAKLDDGMYDDMIAAAEHNTSEATGAEGAVTDETGATAGIAIDPGTDEPAPLPPHLQRGEAASAGVEVAEKAEQGRPADVPDQKVAGTVQTPSVGRIVHLLFHHSLTPSPAIVTGVNPDDTIDVTVFFRHAGPDYMQAVPYGLSPDAVAGWVWPPRA